MKGISFAEFGDAGVLSYGDLPDPIVQADQALVKTAAVGVNPLDVSIRAGYLQPFFNHFLPITPGTDVAGEVVEVGAALHDYQVGDQVMGFVLKDYIKHGTYAELVAIPERLLARMPQGLSTRLAAALPTVGLAAWQSLHLLDVGEGNAVLVNSAAGGVGHVAVQLARQFGATTVIGAASPANHEFVRSLGAEPTTYGSGLESRVAEIVGGDGKVDAVLDLVGEESLTSSFACVRDPRQVVCMRPSSVAERGGRLWAVRPDTAAVERLAKLVDSGELHLEVSEAFPLAEAAAAHRLLEGRHVRGKLILTVE